MNELTREHRSIQIRRLMKRRAEPCCHGSRLTWPTPHEGTKVLDPGDTGFRRLLPEEEGLPFSQNDGLPLATE
jgi:hypothetical protein